MHMEITRAELREATQGLAKLVNGRSSNTLPVLGALRFETGRDGVTASATDLDSTAR